MNLNYLKYVVEVEKTKSITQAAENLFMGQPNLSRAIKELEDSIGLQLFMRSSKGVIPTEQGEKFINYAKGILAKVEEMEALFNPEYNNKPKFKLSAVLAGYITDAISEMVSKSDTTNGIEFYLTEANNMQIINNIDQNISDLGILHFRSDEEKLYRKLLKEKNISFRLIWEHNNILLMHEGHPLAGKQEIIEADLMNYIEIATNKNYNPAEYGFNENFDKLVTPGNNSIINISEWGSRIHLLSQVDQSYMWTFPMPRELLKKYSLVQKECILANKRYKDVLIYKDCYEFNEQDKLFVEELEKSRDKSLFKQ